MAYTEEDLQKQIKPLSHNDLAAFFQRIYRKWLSVWYDYSERHPKGSALLYKIFFFLVFSVGVTVFQYIVMTFLPLAFASLNGGSWGWPNVPVKAAGGQPYIIFGDVNGLGYFIAFEIAVFLSQCINFPLQRNITYRSHGNPWFQAMWYFIGWVLVSVFTNAAWGILNCFIVNWGWPDAIAGIGKTLLTGVVSMVIFFFIFLVIFPDNEKVANNARKKYKKLVAANAPAETVEVAGAKAEVAERKAKIYLAELAVIKAKSQANAKISQYFALKKKIEADGVAGSSDALAEKFNRAVAAVEEKERAVAAFNQAISE